MVSQSPTGQVADPVPVPETSPTNATLLGVVYAAFCYAAGHVVFAYLIGFLNNVVVAKGIDGGTRTTVATALAINLGLVLLWGVQHSLMARGWFKAWWTRFIPAHTERATYLLATALALGILMLGWTPVGGVLWQVDHHVGKLALWAIQGAGWLLILAASFEIDHFSLFGLKQPWLARMGQTPPTADFQTRFIYRAVRHPIQSGFLFGMWATPTMTTSHALFAGLMTGYVFVGLHFEERALIREYGERYLDYKKRVASLVPFVPFL